MIVKTKVQKLAELGLALPSAHPPIADYVRTKRSGDMLFVAGRVSDLRGEVGADVSLEDARVAARDTMLQLLAIVNEEIGGLDAIESVDFVRGFVRSARHFTEQPIVIDGASELLIALWGESGRHARTATGAAQLPFGAAVQIDMIMRLAPVGASDTQGQKL